MLVNLFTIRFDCYMTSEIKIHEIEFHWKFPVNFDFEGQSENDGRP